ncbi:MAG: hypothetical protein J1F28_10225 [Oscillospiraceae bacterium]|nr:hypothetical protein [Oscillospiraceae bacterium]
MENNISGTALQDHIDNTNDTSDIDYVEVAPNQSNMQDDLLRYSLVGSIDDNRSCVKLQDDEDQKKLVESDSKIIANLNECYDVLLSSYTNHMGASLKHKRTMKIWFFVITMVMIFSLAVLLILCVHSMVKDIANLDEIKIEFSVPILTSLISFSTTIIVIPKVIAKHLFNHKEEEAMVKIIEIIQEHDKSIRDNLSK